MKEEIGEIKLGVEGLKIKCDGWYYAKLYPGILTHGLTYHS